jgi:hypothetical protein
MAQDETFGTRAARAMVRLVVVAIIVGLAGTAALLLSKLNARTYRVQFAEGQLRIMKGRNQPLGVEPFRPTDPALVDAYAPIPVRGDPPADILARTFHERDELDRALFVVFETLGKPRLFSEDPQEVQDGLYYLRRAEKLTGLTEEQRRSLKTMQTDIAFHLGREKLDEARRLIAEAMTQLRLAADTMNRNSRSANQMMLEVSPAAKGLEDALRRAVHALSAPLDPPAEPSAPLPSSEPPPAPAPATPPSTQARIPSPPAGAPPPSQAPAPH